MELKNKTVLITGSTDGIGKQTALEAADAGAEVIVHGRDLGIRRPQLVTNRRSKASVDRVGSRSGECVDGRLCGTGCSGSRRSVAPHSWSSWSSAHQ